MAVPNFSSSPINAPIIGYVICIWNILYNMAPSDWVETLVNYYGCVRHSFCVTISQGNGKKCGKTADGSLVHK